MTEACEVKSILLVRNKFNLPFSTETECDLLGSSLLSFSGLRARHDCGMSWIAEKAKGAGFRVCIRVGDDRGQFIGEL